MTQTFRDQLIGTWRLLEYKTEDDKGNTVYPFGEDAKGFIMYNPDGYMVYSGRFEIDEDKGEVRHYMDVSMNPTWEGQSQPRVGDIKGDILEIYNGLTPEDKLRWQKVEAHQ